MKKIFIIILLIGLIMSASTMGYCNANTMDISPQKTTDDVPVYESTNTTDTIAQRATDIVSEYESSTQIGIGTGTPIAIVTGTAIDSAATAFVIDGGIFCAGTYYVLKAEGVNEVTRALAEVPPMQTYHMEKLWRVDKTVSFLEVYDEEEVADPLVITEIPELIDIASVASPYIMAAGLVLLAVIVVVLVTGTVVYLCWSAS